MTATVAEGLSAARAALALLDAGHADAAADLLVAALRYAAPTVDLTADGNRLQVTVREVTP